MVNKIRLNWYTFELWFNKYFGMFLTNTRKQCKLLDVNNSLRRKIVSIKNEMT